MKWTNPGHQFDALAEAFRKRRSILIYGAGNYGETVFKELCFMAGVIDGFVDRSKEKQRTGFCGKPVYDPAILFDRRDEEHLVIVAMVGEKATKLMFRLEKAGYLRSRDFFYFNRFLRMESPPLYAFMLYALGKTYVSSMCVIPSTRCNLNCRDCLNFTPYLPGFTTRPVEEVIRDVDLLFRWVDYTPRFQISGGEPLLYPDLIRLIDHIGTNYRDKIGTHFETVINGTIVPSHELCESMRRNHMIVWLDNYTSAIPAKLDRREEIIRTLEEHQICWLDNTVDEWFTLDIEHTDNGCMSDGELAEYYDTCANPWHYYENGRFYSCNFARFAVKAGLNVEDDNDAFDLSVMTEEDRPKLMEFFLGYTEKGCVEFCKRCAGWGPNNLRPPVPVAIQKERARNDNGSETENNEQ